MRRLAALLGWLLLLSSTAWAQPSPSGASPGIPAVQVFPASAVNGAGVVTGAGGALFINCQAASCVELKNNGANLQVLTGDGAAFAGAQLKSLQVMTNAGGANVFLINNGSTANLLQFVNATNTVGVELNADAATLGACGTSPTLTSGSRAEGGEATSGSATTTCVVNFTTSWTNTPFCVVSDRTTSGGAKVTAISVSSMTVTLTASDVFTWACNGWR